MIFKSQIKKTSNIMEATEYLGEYKFNHKWKAFLIENSKDIFVVNINKNNRDNENLLISIIKQDFISETSKSFRSISLDTILNIQNNNEFDSKIISRVKFDKYYNREEDSYVSNEKIKLFRVNEGFILETKNNLLYSNTVFEIRKDIFIDRTIDFAYQEIPLGINA